MTIEYAIIGTFVIAPALLGALFGYALSRRPEPPQPTRQEPTFDFDRLMAIKLPQSKEHTL
jgi:hypothetical protein